MKLESSKIRGHLARNARFEAPACLVSLVSILWFSSPVTVSLGEAAKPPLPKVSKQVVMLLCVVGVALGDILTCLVESHSVWQAQNFCSFSDYFCGRRGTLKRPSSSGVAGAACSTCCVFW